MKNKITTGLKGVPAPGLKLSAARLSFPPGGDHRQRDGKDEDGGHHKERNAGGYFDLEPLRWRAVWFEQHFGADKDQHRRQPDFQIAEITERAGQQEIKRTQTQDGEDV